MSTVRIRLTAALVALAAVGMTTVTAQEVPLLVEPEEITARLAPLEAVLEGLPPLSAPALSPQEWMPTEVPFGESSVVLEPPAIIDRPTAATTVAGDQLFFTAGLGAASVQSVFADIELYRITDISRFDLGYEHRSADGFAFHDPGSGYFVQRNALAAELDIDTGERTTGGFEAGYEDLRRGLQELSPNYSVENRTLDATVRLAYALDERVSLLFEGDASHSRRLLTDLRADAYEGTTPAEERDRDEMFNRFTPEFGVRFEWPRFALHSAVLYDALVNEADGFPTVSRVEGTLAVEGVLPAGITLRAEGAGAYRFDDGVYFPIEGALEYRGAERWSLTLGGGLRYSEALPVDLWSRYPTLGVPEAEEPPGLTERLFVEGGLEVVLLPERLTVGGEVSWSDWEDRLVADEFDESEGYYPLAYRDEEEFDYTVAATLTILPWLLLDGEWHARTLDRPTGDPENEAVLGVRVERGIVEAAATTTTPIDGEVAVPRIDVESTFTLTENLSLELFARDLLAPTLEDGRGLGGTEPTSADPFIQEGLEIGALLRISY